MRSLDNPLSETFTPDPPGTPGSLVRAGITVERAAAKLKADILEGRYAPGQRLISRDIVDKLGVSRSSLREAFRRLEADGLVEVVPNRGAVVRVLSSSEVRHIFQIREALEGYAVQQAALRIDEGDNRARLTAVLARGLTHRTEPVFQQFIVDNRDFHQEIVRICGNPPLAELIDKSQLPILVIQLRDAITLTEMIRNTLDEHEAIAAGILDGDPAAAYDAMKRHLWHAADLLLAHSAAGARERS